MILSPAVIKGIAKHLQDYEREILCMLLNEGLSVKKMAASLPWLSSCQVAAKLRALARRTMVVHVPSSAGDYWCLTAEGKQVANFVIDQ